MVNAVQHGKSTRRRVRLQPRDEQILREHVACFRLTTYGALHALFWPDDTLNAAKSWVRRMREGGLLASVPLYGRTRYFHVTAKAARLLHLDSRAPKPQKAAYLATTFGRLAFCCLGQTHHRKLSVVDFKTKFPELVLPRDANDGYYIDRTLHQTTSAPERTRLGFIFVDDARSLRRIPVVLNRLISRRLRIPAWKSDVIRKQSFVITVVTTTDGKRNAIEQAIVGLHPEMLFSVECCPDLRNVIHERSPRYAAKR